MYWGVLAWHLPGRDPLKMLDAPEQGLTSKLRILILPIHCSAIFLTLQERLVLHLSSLL